MIKNFEAFTKLAPSTAKTLKYHPANRMISKRKVDFFFKELINGESATFPNILVEVNTRYVIDGQHRLEAYKRWWDTGVTEPIKVQYIDLKPEQIVPKIQKLNCVSSAWTTTDYYRSLMATGNDGAKLLTDFCVGKELLSRQVRESKDKKFPLPNMRFASNLLCGRTFVAEIKDGTISQCVTPEVIEYGEWTYQTFMAMYNAVGYVRVGSTGWLEYAIRAWYRIMHDPIYSEFIKSISLEELGEIMAESVTPDTNNNADGFEALYKAALYAHININSFK